MNILPSFRDNKLNIWILYYLVLGVIQALWTNLTAFPPLPLRLVMVLAVFVPLFIRYDLILFVYPFFITLRGNLSTSYQYLPDVYSYSFYILLAIILLIYHHRFIRFYNIKYVFPILLMIALWGLVDIFNNYAIGGYAIHAFFIVLMIPFIRKHNDCHLLSAAIITVSTLLALYYIIMFDSFAETWNAAEGLERAAWRDPNYFSTLIDSGFLISLMYVPSENKPNIFVFNTQFCIISSIIIFIAVTMTASRAGFICYVAVLIIFAICNKVKFRWFVLWLLSMALVIILMYKLGVFDVLIYRFFEQGNLESGGDRTTIWQLALNNFTNQPFLLQLFGGGYWHRATLSSGADMHNEILAVLMDYGVVGLSLFVFFILKMVNLRSTKNVLFVNIPVIFYLLAIISLSQFQYIYIVFLILWIVLYKEFSTKLFNI